MKFIYRKGAPDIPLDLIAAQERKELVFFCGAGVSFPAELPSFSDLVSRVYEGLHEDEKKLEERAKKDGFLDRMLGLLETRLQEGNTTRENLVRRQILKELEVEDPADVDVETHKALLSLSRLKKDRFRLVTTNVDHCFLLADPNVKECCDAAPKLPVPKPHKWHSVVHLHGLADKKNDPDGENLVFTSGDFGAAYLTERWASKFVTDLFLNFNVLFVGYSIDDPVIRYMTDAIAAERRQGNELFKQAYVLADATRSKMPVAKGEWRAKGVEPILYEKGNKYHKNLHDTLRAWAKHVRDGLEGKHRIIRSYAKAVPVVPYDDKVIRVIETLKETNSESGDEVTGQPAKVFSEMDPPPPIEWLSVLDEEGLLSQGKKAILCDPVADFPGRHTTTPSIITRHLWDWLVKYLNEKELAHWFIGKGSFVHPELVILIDRNLKNDD